MYLCQISQLHSTKKPWVMMSKTINCKWFRFTCYTRICCWIRRRLEYGMRRFVSALVWVGQVCLFWFNFYVHSARPIHDTLIMNEHVGMIMFAFVTCENLIIRISTITSRRRHVRGNVASIEPLLSVHVKSKCLLIVTYANLSCISF